MGRETSHQNWCRGRLNDSGDLSDFARLWLTTWLARLVGVLRAVGPYVLLELLLPGGTLIAICLWLYRRYAARKSQVRLSPAVCAS